MNILTMNPILIAAAVIPAVFLLIRVYKADRLDREPKGLLISLVILGILSTISAIILERIGTAILSSFLTEGTFLYNLLEYFIVVAISEEGSKYFLLKLRTWKHPAFNCQFDGVVYAVFVSLGFALWENIGYVAMLGFSTALIRAVTAVPGHACFGVFMGVFYGAAKRAELAGKPNDSKTLRRLALLFPAFIHGAYDFITTLPGLLSAFVFLPFIICVFAFAYRIVKTHSMQDTFIVEPQEPTFFPPDPGSTTSAYPSNNPQAWQPRQTSTPADQSVPPWQRPSYESEDTPHFSGSSGTSTQRSNPYFPDNHF
ncbi:MAG: PrsW family intramembrane metalloprotease [Clostridia bacterium]|nr:PrsW family intramembrane metalloprotease [Clostridia bacterium]